MCYHPDFLFPRSSTTYTHVHAQHITAPSRHLAHGYSCLCQKHILPPKLPNRVEVYYLRSRIQECIAASSTREESVTPAAILAMSARLCMPTRAEVFDALYFVARTESGFSISDWTE